MIGAYVLVVALVLDLGIIGTQLHEGLGEWTHLHEGLDNCAILLGIAFVVSVLDEGMSRHNLLPEWLATQPTSSICGTLGLLIWIGLAQGSDVLEQDLLGLFEVVLDA